MSEGTQVVYQVGDTFELTVAIRAELRSRPWISLGQIVEVWKVGVELKITDVRNEGKYPVSVETADGWSVGLQSGLVLKAMAAKNERE